MAEAGRARAVSLGERKLGKTCLPSSAEPWHWLGHSAPTRRPGSRSALVSAAAPPALPGAAPVSLLEALTCAFSFVGAAT